MGLNRRNKSKPARHTYFYCTTNFLKYVLKEQYEHVAFERRLLHLNSFCAVFCFRMKWKA